MKKVDRALYSNVTCLKKRITVSAIYFTMRTDFTIVSILPSIEHASMSTYQYAYVDVLTFNRLTFPNSGSMAERNVASTTKLILGRNLC